MSIHHLSMQSKYTASINNHCKLWCLAQHSKQAFILNNGQCWNYMNKYIIYNPHVCLHVISTNSCLFHRCRISSVWGIACTIFWKLFLYNLVECTPGVSHEAAPLVVVCWWALRDYYTTLGLMSGKNPFVCLHKISVKLLQNPILHQTSHRCPADIWFGCFNKPIK